jgi:hypothetical protein
MMGLKLSTTDKEILLNGRPIYFIAKDRYLPPKEIFVQQDTNVVAFKFASDGPATLVVPCFDGEVFVGDEYEPVDTNRVSEWYSPGPTELMAGSTASRIYAPFLHVVSDNVFSYSVFGECLISCFQQAYEEYASLTGVPHEGFITFYLHATENMKVALGQFGVRPREPRIFPYSMDRNEMESCIYYGTPMELVEPNADKLIDVARMAQGLFARANLDSIITGSLAQYLNNQDCFVQDIDIMLRDRPSMVHAAEILNNYKFERTINEEKWIRMEGDAIIDLSYDNHNVMTMRWHRRESHQLVFMDSEGLMWMSLVALYECYRNKDPQMARRVSRSLFEMTAYAFDRRQPCNSVVGLETQLLEQYRAKCIELANQLSQYHLLFKDTRVNKPFRVNCFGENETTRHYAVINLGLKANLRLVTDFIAETAMWIDISGEQKVARIEKHDGFSMIFVDELLWPGVLTCTMLATPA